LYPAPKIKTFSEKNTFNRLKTKVKREKKTVSLGHSVKIWKTVSRRPQNGHVFETAGFKTEIKVFEAMAPCSTLHWRWRVPPPKPKPREEVQE
jgi:hypothetical protein